MKCMLQLSLQLFYEPVTVHSVRSATLIVPHIYNTVLVLPLTVYTR